MEQPCNSLSMLLSRFMQVNVVLAHHVCIVFLLKQPIATKIQYTRDEEGPHSGITFAPS